MRRIGLLLILLVFMVGGLIQLGRYDLGPVVVTRDDQQKVIFRLQKPVEVTEPGLSLRIGVVPGLEVVKTFERRWLYLASQPETIQTKERVPLQVDKYVIWRIDDPLLFDKSFPGGLDPAGDRIGREVNTRVREILGTRTLEEVVTTRRTEIIEEITRQSRERLADYGIHVGDVRIVRTELPDKTLRNVYGRMAAERERLAREFRAKGEQRAREIHADADAEARVIVARAREQSEKLRARATPRPPRSTLTPTPRTPSSTISCAAWRPTARPWARATPSCCPPTTSSSRCSSREAWTARAAERPGGPCAGVP